MSIDPGCLLRRPYEEVPIQSSPPALPMCRNFLNNCPDQLYARICCKTPSRAAMQAHRNVATMGMLHGFDETTVDEYDSQAKLLQDFYKVPSVDKAWIFKSDSVGSSRAMFSISQMNIMANKKRNLILSSHITKTNNQSVDFQWSPFPVEMNDVSAVVPSPSGSKLLVVRNMEDESPTQIEIWGSGQLEKAIPIPKSVHGSLFVDGWFEGMSWNYEETHIAYVAEEPTPSKPIFTDSGFKGEGSFNKDCGTWFGQGDWEENWGETYSKKRRSTLFVVRISSGEVQAVKGISKLLSVGQVVWVPSVSSASEKYLVFVGWSSENCLEKPSRKLGIKYCYNRPCALYAVRAPFKGHDDNESTFNTKNLEDVTDAINLTASLRSAFFPTFCPDGKYLVFLSAENAVDSGAHLATNSLHRLNWPADGRPDSSAKVSCVVPVVMCPMDGSFPGLYCSHFLPYPWLSDGYTMILSSIWRSTEAIISINILGGKIQRVTPSDSIYSWDVLAIDRDDILATTSCPIDPPQLKYGTCTSHMEESSWSWLDVSCPVAGCFDKIRSLLSSHQCSVLKVPVNDSSETLSEGAKRPFEAIFISHSSSESKESCNENKEDECSPVIVVLHGGPHSAFSTTYSKSMAFLLSLGYNLLLVNYRGSLGFGEEAVQSLPGKVGSQDVNDVLASLDYVKEKGLIDGSKVAVLGGSHGGFLTTHLVGQAPDRFVAAAVRNPVCNLALMVGITDIPDWCYIEAYGKEGKELFSEAPSAENLRLFYSKSPISHISKVKTPMLFLLGAKDLRVPVSNGLQYARALKERGVEVKIIVFPDDVHAIQRPQSDFESFLNIGVWFNKHCKPRT